MNLELIAIGSLILAAIPCGLFFLNLAVYRPIKPTNRHPQIDEANPAGTKQESVSVLIPARNEERNMESTLLSVLASTNIRLEVVVLDDHSTDRTADIVRQLAQKDDRLRLESAPPLPVGWCGKQHACHVLATRARHAILVFLDADVRLAPDALERICHFLKRSGAGLVSGVPRQECRTLSERLLIPLIHFVLLGFLPMHLMRRSRMPSLSAGCGQMFAVHKSAYAASGGHAGIRDSLHDGVKLPRVFRRAGFGTDLFDATDVAVCRMYLTNEQTWQGLGKNATEGLAAPGTLLPMTILLLGGQSLPFLLMLLSWNDPSPCWIAALAACLSWAPRLAGVFLFKQHWLGAMLHPVSVGMLVAIQWWAFLKHLTGRPSEWKGRFYMTTPDPAKSA